MAMGLIIGLGSSPAVAGEQAHGLGVGVRAGFGLQPDQFVAGVQAVMGKIANVVRFAPSADVGFGDNVTVLTLNPDFRLAFSPPKSDAIFYGQVGPTIALIDPKHGDGDTEIGLTLSGGLNFPMGTGNLYTLEARIGIGDIPDIRVLFGLQFGGR
jgi:hypothetical protein